MLGLGAAKGSHGVGLTLAQPSSVISKTPIRHLADFKGKKIWVFASQFQTMAFNRLGATPVAMTLGDVLPALQQGAIDGAVAGVGPFVHLHFGDAAKYITETNQPAIFLVLEVSQTGTTRCPRICKRSSTGTAPQCPWRSIRWRARCTPSSARHG